MARKLFVAVHGVGDQRQFDTVQHVARQVLREASPGSGPRLSLGVFSSNSGAGVVPSTIDAVYWHASTQQPSEEYGFAEVYWADLCRGPERAGYRLEEGVPWAQTLVDRVKALKATTPTKPGISTTAEPDYELVRAVVGEMGDGLHLIGWLTALAPKLQLPTFKIDDLVNRYLGDVQFVAEFADVREEILGRFRKTLDGVTATLKLRPTDEIYLITHSEGTVVTLLGLLTAMTSGATAPDWLKHVRGWMTIGSPIDKHLILWPELWTQFASGPLLTHLPPQPIVWWNYADCGDPIGFDLNSTRRWMRDNCSVGQTSWTRAFHFEATPTPKGNNGQYIEARQNIFECVYTRYAWPGQAHLDYWDDNELFDHFLREVAHTAAHSIPPQKQQLKPKPVYFPPLPDIRAKQIWSLTVPYFMAFLVLVMGMFFLDKGIWLAQGLKHDKALPSFICEILSLSFLLAGTTVLARMPRIVRQKWRFTAIGLVIFGALAGAFYGLFPTETQLHLCNQLGLSVRTPVREGFIVFALVVGVNAILLRVTWWRYVMTGVCASALLGLMVMSFAKLLGRPLPYIEPMIPHAWPQWFGLWATAMCFTATMLWTVRENREGHSAGLWPLIGPGFTGVVGMGAALAVVGVTATQRVADGITKEVLQPTLWPLFIGAVAFLFLWKLAAILFDLTFVWHRYIKQNVMLQWFRDNLE